MKLLVACDTRTEGKARAPMQVASSGGAAEALVPPASMLPLLLPLPASLRALGGLSGESVTGRRRWRAR